MSHQRAEPSNQPSRHHAARKEKKGGRASVWRDEPVRGSRRFATGLSANRVAERLYQTLERRLGGVARRYFVGTRRFNSSVQGCTTMSAGGAALASVAGALIIRKRCPSDDTSYVRPAALLPEPVKYRPSRSFVGVPACHVAPLASTGTRSSACRHRSKTVSCCSALRAAVSPLPSRLPTARRRRSERAGRRLRTAPNCWTRTPASGRRARRSRYVRRTSSGDASSRIQRAREARSLGVCGSESAHRITLEMIDTVR